MLKEDIKSCSSEGPEFDCYLVTPETAHQAPAIVLASAIYGVDSDLRGIADEFASHGYIAAARISLLADHALGLCITTILA